MGNSPMFCNTYRSVMIWTQEDSNTVHLYFSLYPCFTISSPWCKGEFLLFTIIFLLNTGFALTSWGVGGKVLILFWWLAPPHLEAELLRSFRVPWGAPLMPSLLLPRSLYTAWRSPWGQIQPDVHQAFQGQEKLKGLSIILKPEASLVGVDLWAYPLCKGPLAIGVTDFLTVLTLTS